MPIPIIQVNAFTNTPFSGNPAAVCLLPELRDAAWMQHVAREMNLSETAFLVRQADGFDLRWFTPAVEVDLCGHATLASAHVLWQTGYLQPHTQARFQTRSGLLTADKQGDWIELDFPATPPTPVAAPEDLLAALGVTAQSVQRSRFDYLVEVDSEATIRALHPDFTRLRSLDMRGIIVTSRANTPEYDIISRFFAPAAGIDEDPVTGSAHCCLAPFWADRIGKQKLVGYQASARGGMVRMYLDGDRVRLGGQAVTIWQGQLVIEK